MIFEKGNNLVQKRSKTVGRV